MKKLLNPVLGESLEDLHCAELECQRCARRETQLNSVLGGNLDDLHLTPPARPGTGMSTICSAISCWSEERDNTVGTFTNCSASYVSRHNRRRGTSRGKIFGTSITGSATTSNCAAKNCTAFGSCSLICGTGTSRRWTNSYAMPSCRSVFPCGQGSISAAGRPVGLQSSDESSKYSAGPTPVLVTFFWPLEPSLECEWWVMLLVVLVLSLSLCVACCVLLLRAAACCCVLLRAAACCWFCFACFVLLRGVAAVSEAD